MDKQIHIEITKKALFNDFTTQALNEIIKANIRQDRIKYLIGHDYIHFDSNAFLEGFAYIEEQENNLIDSVINARYHDARKAFGRILHSWQDFYSHSNYINILIERDGKIPPETVPYADPTIIQSPNLHSGKIYGILELLSLVPVVSSIITPLMPKDSHKIMNLDNPKAGPLFKYAYLCALKRTENCKQTIFKMFKDENISNEKVRCFQGESNPLEKV